MENPTETQENSLENKDSNIEFLTTMVEYYKTDLYPKIHEYLQVSKIIFDDDASYNADLQRAALLKLTSELALLTAQVKAELAENEELISSLGVLYSQLDLITKNLAQAPDTRYSEEGLVKKFNGEKNIPAGRTSYEDTRESVLDLMSIFKGIELATKMLK